MPLTWRNVEIPRFDMRDYMTAGEGMTNAFNSLATMLHARDQRIGQEATGQGLVNVLSQDRAGLEELIRSGGVMPGQQPLDRRADMARIMEAAVGHRSTLLNQGVAGENLANLEAQSEFGEIGADIERLERMGDVEGAAALRAEASAREGWGRVAPTIEGRAGAAHSGWHTRMHSDRTFEEQVSQNEFTRRDANRRYDLQNQRFQWERARAEAPTRGQQLAGLANSLAAHYGSDDVDRLTDNEAFRNLDESERESVRTMFLDRSNALESDSPAANTVIGDRLRTTISHTQQLAQEARENAISSPAQRVALAIPDMGDVDRPTVLKQAENSFSFAGLGGREGNAAGIVDNLISKGYSLKEISAALQYSPRSTWRSGTEKSLESLLQEARRNPAERIIYMQDSEAAPFDRALERLNSISRQMNRESNLTGSDAPSRELSQALTATELAAGNAMMGFQPSNNPRAGFIRSQQWANDRFGAAVMDEARNRAPSPSEELRQEAATTRAPSAGGSTEGSVPSIEDTQRLAVPSMFTSQDWEAADTVFERRDRGRTDPTDSQTVARIREASNSPQEFMTNLENARQDLYERGAGSDVSRADRPALRAINRELSRVSDSVVASRGIDDEVNQVTSPENMPVIESLLPGEEQEAIATSSNPARAQVLMDKVRQGEATVPERRELRRLLFNR